MIRSSTIVAIAITLSACAGQDPIEIEMSSSALVPQSRSSTAQNENSRRGELGGGIREATDYGTGTVY